MIKQKNRFMLWICLSAVVLTIPFHLMGRVWGVLNHDSGHTMGLTAAQYSQQFAAALNTLLLLPMLLFICSLVLHRARPDHPAIPVLNTLVLTFSSISIIAGGGGMVELHFSIFMVIAMLAYYESIPLVLIMTAIFAVQHLAGYWLRPEIVFGSHEYSFLMVCVHALFLLFTAGATILQINSSARIKQAIETGRRQENEKMVAGIVQRLSAASREIVQTAGELSSTAEQTSESSREIAAAMNEITGGTETQVHGSRQSVTAMQEMASGINRIAESSSEVSHTANQSVRQAAEGNKSVHFISEQMAMIQTSVTESDEAVKSLYDRSQEIDQIVITIKGIAEQTNLLALNASIEASRAGEQGRGFSVVASEIRKLAEQSSGMTERITELVRAMQHDSLGSVNAMRHVKEKVELGLTTIHSTKKSFEDLVDLSKQVAEHVQEISAAAEQMSASSQQVAASIHEMSDVAGETAAQTQKISTQSNQQLTLFESIHGSASLLKKSSQELEMIMTHLQKESLAV